MSDPEHTTSEKKRVERMNRFLRTIALLLFLPFAAASADMLAPTPQMGSTIGTRPFADQNSTRK
jgi:hypothetical protein